MDSLIAEEDEEFLRAVPSYSYKWNIQALMQRLFTIFS